MRQAGHSLSILSVVSDKKGPYVVEVTQAGQEPQYLSAAGIHDDGPLLDKIAEAAEFDRKGDARYFAHITGQHVDGSIAVVRQSEAQARDLARQQLDVEATHELRAETQAAYDAWQQDLQNVELEYDYFEKLTDLDRNLEQRGLERGEDIDEELPLRSIDELMGRSLDQSIEQSLGRDGRER
jgi:hypothetical protein